MMYWAKYGITSGFLQKQGSQYNKLNRADHLHGMASKKKVLEVFFPNEDGNLPLKYWR